MASIAHFPYCPLLAHLLFLHPGEVRAKLSQGVFCSMFVVGFWWMVAGPVLASPEDKASVQVTRVPPPRAFQLMLLCFWLSAGPGGTLGHLRFSLKLGLEILGVSGCLCSPVGWKAEAGAVSIQVLVSARCLHSVVFNQSRVSVHAGDTSVRLSHCFSPSFPIAKCKKTLVQVQFCHFYRMDNTNVSVELLLFFSPAVFPVHNLSIFNLLHSDLFS